MQHLLDLGIAHRQTFSPQMIQLALETDPHDISDSRHVLNIGNSDAEAGVDAPEPATATKKRKQAAKRARKKAAKA